MGESCCASCRYTSGHTSWCRFGSHPQGGVVNESPLVFVRLIVGAYPPRLVSK